MTRLRRAARLLVALTICTLPATAGALSAVFDGDPVDPSSGLPYEILPGKPLVEPGPDGQLGTADDVVNPAVIGDIDLVVRSGSVPATAIIPPSALAGGRAALPQGVAGPPNAGGTAIPFTVLLSDGAISASAPAGHWLAAPDMDGIPVVVAAFADLDGDGVIGPTTHDLAGRADLGLELRELLPVGRTAALFSGGVARGSIAVQRALPQSQGGLTVALVAMALTGPFDVAFFGGAIPSGPAIATALPFLPQRDLSRLIRDRVVPAGPGTTLQQLIEFAAVPAPDAYALPLDGGSPTIDGAIVVSQPAVRVVFRDGGAQRGADAPLERTRLGMSLPASLAHWRLVPVDRFDNPADPPRGFAVMLRSDAPLRLLAPRDARLGRPLLVRDVNGVRVLGRVEPHASDGAAGTLRAERDGVVVAAQAYDVDAGADRPGTDVIVPSPSVPTIQAAVDGATDRNHDGRVVVAVRAGLYRENVVISRPLELIGDGSDVTFIQGDGTTSALAVTAAGAVVRGVTAVGGASGFSLSGGGVQLADSAAWRNLGVGIAVSGAAVEIRAGRVIGNGGDGVAIAGSANGAVCADTLLFDNFGNGLAVAAASTQVSRNRAVHNAAGGVTVNGAGTALLDDNQSVLNLGSGIDLLGAPAAVVSANLCTMNDEDGIRIESSDGVSVTANVFDDNKGYGVFLRRTSGGDFDTAPGLQDPLGDNEASGNRKGDLFIRPD
jgi:hypothetical protein